MVTRRQKYEVQIKTSASGKLARLAVTELKKYVMALFESVNICDTAEEADYVFFAGYSTGVL